MADLYSLQQRRKSVEHRINELRRELTAYENELLQIEWGIDRLIGQQARKIELAQQLIGKSIYEDGLISNGFTAGQIKVWLQALEWVTSKKHYGDGLNVTESNGAYNANSMKKLVADRYFTEERQEGFRSARATYLYRITIKGLQFLLDNTI